MNENLLVVRNLKVSFQSSRESLEVIRGFEADIPHRGIVGILGESGSGKTVSAKSLLGLLDRDISRVDSGTAEFHGQDLLKLKESELRNIRGNYISYVFQDPAKTLNPYIPVGRQIEQTLKCHGMDQAGERTRAALLSAGIEDPESIYHRRPTQLSGGQCQRVMIAQAVATRPELIIADEPTSSIDASIRKTILDLFVSLNQKTGTSIIVISHDFDVIRYMCHSIIVMYGGLVMESGDIDSVMSGSGHPYTQELLRCAESLNSRDAQLYSLKGRPPTVHEFRNCCPFADRCRYILPECHNSIPELTDFRGRKVRCFHPLGEEGHQ